MEQLPPDQRTPDLARAGAGLVELGVAQQRRWLAVQPRSPLALTRVALSASLLRAVTPVTARRERCAYISSQTGLGGQEFVKCPITRAT